MPCACRAHGRPADRDVQGQFGAVQNSAEHQEIFGDDLLDVVCDEDLVVVEFDLALEILVVFPQFREEQDPLEIEGIVGVQVQMEERLAVVGKDLLIEFLVFLFGAVGGVLLPERMDIVLRLLLFLLLALFWRLFGFFFVGKVDLDRHKTAILREHLAQFPLRKVFLPLGIHVQDDGRAARAFDPVGVDGVIPVLSADPADGGRVGIGFGDHLDLVRDHIRGVEAQPEVSDDPVSALAALALVFFNEFKSARERDLADIAFQLVLAHPDPVVRDRNSLRRLIERDVDPVVLAFRRLVFSERRKPLQFGNRVDRVRDQFAQKDISLRIEPFLDDREHVLRLERDAALSCSFFCRHKNHLLSCFVLARRIQLNF